MRWLLALPLALLLTMPADARPRPYPHKAGVTLEAYSADESACYEDAGKAMRDPAYRPAWMPPPSSQFPAASAAGSAIGSGFAAGIEGGKRFKLTLHDCMVAKGYAWHRPSKEEDRAVKRLKGDARQNAYMAWISAAETTHEAAPRDHFD